MTELGKLALKYSSDKEGHHDYCQHYERHFKEFKGKEIKILEFGIGGYEFPNLGGAGLRMWSEFFSIGRVYGVDIHDKSKVTLPPRTKIFKGSQNDGEFLTTLFREIGNPQIIIDDASHMNKLTIETFKHCFPYLKSGGLYCIEDIESSWWDVHGFDGNPDIKNMHFPSTVNFCRELINDINFKYIYKDVDYPISEMHFYPNLVIIKKK